VQLLRIRFANTRGNVRVASTPMEYQIEIYRVFYEALATQRRFNKAAKFKDLHAIGAPG